MMTIDFFLFIKIIASSLLLLLLIIRLVNLYILIILRILFYSILVVCMFSIFNQTFNRKNQIFSYIVLILVDSTMYIPT